MIHVTNSIRVRNSRYNGGPDPYVIDHESTVPRAFESLVFGEIGFGTSIVELTPRRIVCRTNVLGCIDVVEFTGPEDEMAPLYRAASYYGELLRVKRGEIIEHVGKLLPRGRNGGYRPLDVVHFSGLIMGHSLMGLVSLMAIGVEPTAELMQHSAEDLPAAAVLHLETGVPVSELVA